MRNTSKTNLCAGAGLACLFSGIWLGDASLLPLTSWHSPDAAMRVISLALYLVMFLVVKAHVSKRKGIEESDDAQRRFLTLAGGVGIALFALGAILLWLGFGRFADAVSPSGSVVSCAVALTFVKCVGPPLSIASVCLFARINADDGVRTAVAGFFGAFIIDSVCLFAFRAGAFTDSALFAICSALIAASYLATIYGLRITPVDEKPDHSQPSARMGRTVRQAIDRDFIVAALVASMMLGYLRGGMGTTTGTSFIGGAILIIVGLFIWRQASWGIQEVFRGAIACVTAGILLEPLLQLASPDAAGSIMYVGTAMFEAVVWLLAVRCAHSCTHVLLAATAARLVMVAGHLLGSVIALIALYLNASAGVSQQTFSMMLAFGYVMLLLFLFQNPNQILSLRNHEFDADLIETPKEPETPVHADERSEDAYWAEPCAQVACSYGLTPRETDVLEQLARGRTLGAMEERFVLSRNTIKMHVKHVYQKLDVHSKEEVIDMVDDARQHLRQSR